MSKDRTEDGVRSVLQSISLVLKGEKDKKYGLWLSSHFQGVLMQLLEHDYTDELHTNRLHAYSQYLQVGENQLIWTVNALNREACDHITEKMCDSNLKEFYLERAEDTFHVIRREVRTLTYEELISQYFFGQCSKYISLRLLTPTSFKQNGEYVLFPSVRLIFQSLMQKFDSASRDNKLFSEELLEHYETYARIVDYRLRSTRFHMEGVRIPAVLGEITIKINGPQQMVNAAALLAQFGTFSGIGIKTGMGMGALQILDKQ